MQSAERENQHQVKQQTDDETHEGVHQRVCNRQTHNQGRGGTNQTQGRQALVTAAGTQSSSRSTQGKERNNQHQSGNPRQTHVELLNTQQVHHVVVNVGVVKPGTQRLNTTGNRQKQRRGGGKSQHGKNRLRTP